MRREVKEVAKGKQAVLSPLQHWHPRRPQLCRITGIESRRDVRDNRERLGRGLACLDRYRAVVGPEARANVEVNPEIERPHRVISQHGGDAGPVNTLPISPRTPQISRIARLQSRIEVLAQYLHRFRRQPRKWNA